VPPRPVTPDWLYKRSIYISPEQSAVIQQALMKINVLDAFGNVNYDVRVVRGSGGCAEGEGKQGTRVQRWDVTSADAAAGW